MWRVRMSVYYLLIMRLSNMKGDDMEGGGVRAGRQ